MDEERKTTHTFPALFLISFFLFLFFLSFLFCSPPPAALSLAKEAPFLPFQMVAAVGVVGSRLPRRCWGLRTEWEKEPKKKCCWFRPRRGKKEKGDVASFSFFRSHFTFFYFRGRLLSLSSSFFAATRTRLTKEKHLGHLCRYSPERDCNLPEMMMMMMMMAAMILMSPVISQSFASINTCAPRRREVQYVLCVCVWWVTRLSFSFSHANFVRWLLLLLLLFCVLLSLCLGFFFSLLGAGFAIATERKRANERWYD